MDLFLLNRGRPPMYLQWHILHHCTDYLYSRDMHVMSHCFVSALFLCHAVVDWFKAWLSLFTGRTQHYCILRKLAKRQWSKTQSVCCNLSEKPSRPHIYVTRSDAVKSAVADLVGESIKRIQIQTHQSAPVTPMKALKSVIVLSVFLV